MNRISETFSLMHTAEYLPDNKNKIKKLSRTSSHHQWEDTTLILHSKCLHTDITN